MYKYIDHLPTVLQEIKEFQTIGAVVDEQMEQLQLRFVQLFSNRFIDTADLATLKRMQQIFGLEHNPDMRIDEIRGQVKSRKQMRFIINLARIRTMVDEITHGDTTITIDYDLLELTIKLALTSKHNFNSVQALLEDTVPANLVQKIRLLYNQHGTLKNFTHGQLAGYTHKQLREDVIE